MSKEYPTPGELFSLEGDVAVVTGGGRGIGEGIARTLASAGAKVVVAARRVHEIEAVAAAIRADGGQAIAVETDVTSDEAMENLAKAAIKEFGKLSIWINNAGGSRSFKDLHVSEEAWQEAITLNFHRPRQVADALIDQMIERITLDDINVAFDRIRSTEAARQVVIF
jgi:3-oxoacyl-[acyl-carrier protein] reductase